ncbi:putative Co/Zn/Cd efflux system membrane fusion protein [Acidisarcina polymorpha]|uniref:Putative Co/Zn/Cd efflux system membrane fusion protein n=2 Tax=Acidisarcina polymorpha TaxID=2211140 RepID=A0A2Z5FY03_9BACT|nr:putative Co/Zn/Cd efflux system membrane fusion protein [Acidisarcina polymorpha]
MLLAVLLPLTGCKQSESTPPTEVEVESAPAAQTRITEHIIADAVLAPLAQAAIAPRITAPVSRFYIQRGSKVKAGELLATLENRDLQAAVTDSQGSYDAAQASYQTTTKAVVPEDYQKAELDLAQAKANLELNQKIVESRKQLFAQGALPGRDLDTAEAALVQAQAAFDSAQKHLAGMREVSREAALKNAKGQLESAEGKYSGAQAQLAYSEVKSPIAGVVTERPLFAGETAAAGTPLITIMDTSALLAKLHLSQSQAQLLHLGNPASVTVPGVAEPEDGRITLISPALDPGSTTVEVWVRIGNSDGMLRPGTAVKVSLAGRTVDRAVVVPAQAIVTTQSGKKAVMVIGKDQVAHRTPVETGIEDGGLVQIVSGVTAGAQIVTNGSYALDDGAKVKVVQPSEKDADEKPAAGESK